MDKPSTIAFAILYVAAFAVMLLFLASTGGISCFDTYGGTTTCSELN